MTQNLNVPSGAHQPAAVVTGPDPATRPPSALGRAGLAVVAALVCVLLLDAAVETFLAGAAVRWVVAAVVVAYLVVGILAWRRLSPGGSASLSLLVLCGLVAFTAWWPGGTSAGLVMVRQPASSTFAALTTMAILLAGWSMLRLKALPAALRAVAALLVLYAVTGTVWGIAAATPFPALIHGQSAWMGLPFWLQGAFIGGLVLVPAGLLIQAVTGLVGRRGSRRSTEWLFAGVSALSVTVVAAGFGAPGDGGAAGLSGWARFGINGPGLRPVTIASLQLPVPRTFDLSHVDPKYFAAALGNDPARIFDFVRDQVAYESYAGCLRGPRGTLLAMAGNSVDRASLLASLLQNAGQRVRFAHGTLPQERARELAASMWVEHPTLAASDGHGKPLPDVDAAGASLLAGIKRDGDRLRDSLTKAGIPGPDGLTTSESFVTETQDHYWVQWERGGAWTDLDPSYATATPGTAYTTAAATFETLPDALFHRIDIRVRVEEYTGDKPSSRDVLSYAARAADLSGVDLALTHEDTSAGEPAQDPQGGLLGAPREARPAGHQVRPVIRVGEQQVPGSPFQLNVRGASASRGAAGVFGALSGDAEPAPSGPVATAEFLELQFVWPGGRAESVVREVFDLVGPAKRTKGERLTADAVRSLTDGAHAEVADATFDICLTTGAVHPAFVAGLARPTADPGSPLDLRTSLRRLGLAFSALSDGLLGRVVDARGNVVRSYFESPRVVISEASIHAGAVRVCIDLRRDQARVASALPGAGQLFFAQVLRGVVDGTLERLVIDHVVGASPEQNAGAAPFSTSVVFELADAGRVPVVLLPNGERTALSADVPPDGRARIDAALAAGQLVLAPRDPVPVAGVSRTAWWQVNPRTGTTIAVTDEGLHQSTTEATVIRYKDKVGVALKVDGKFLPKSEWFRTMDQADWFVVDLQKALADRGITMSFRGADLQPGPGSVRGSRRDPSDCPRAGAVDQGGERLPAQPGFAESTGHRQNRLDTDRPIDL